jgi:cellulose synthase/poly-beta-1,6-N-acetylglucosamine synthase-like glycosyltransferase
LVLRGTIDALVAADCDRRDIYVVNDQSTDYTMLVAFEAGVNVYTVPQNGGKARAQTQALQYFDLLVKYDWVIFLDGDTKVDPYFINRMYKAAKEDPSVALYVGQVKSVKNNHIFSASRAFDYTYGQDVAKQGQSNFNVIFVSPGCASMYRTDVLAKLDIDHNTLAEDMDLTMQVHRAGGKVTYLPDAIVNTQDPNTLGDYHKQILRWYRGFWQVVKKHGVFGFTKKQPVDVYMILITLDAMLLNRPFWLVTMAFIAPNSIPWILLLDIGVSFAISLYAGYRTKRTDVITKFPLYYWIGYLNFYAYIRAFVEIIVLRKEILAWNKVKRYDFSSNSTA